jgi:hypothetical protein
MPDQSFPSSGGNHANYLEPLFTLTKWPIIRSSRVFGLGKVVASKIAFGSYLREQNFYKRPPFSLLGHFLFPVLQQVG